MNPIRSLLLLCIAGLTCAQTYDSNLFASLKWRNIGPNRGGRSLACAGSPSRPLEYYFGAVGGGLWKTIDGGTTWKPVTDGQLASSSVGAIAVSPSNPDVVYIGMSRTGIRGRLRDHVVRKSGLWTHFSVYAVWPNITDEEIRELEGLFRAIYRKDTRANSIAVQKGFAELGRIRDNKFGWTKL